MRFGSPTIPLHRQPAGNAQVEAPAMASLAKALARQGAVWRSVLDGSKLCTDMLGPQDYLQAGDRLARHYVDLFFRALRRAPWLPVLLMLLLSAVVLLLVLIPGSAVARTATAIAAIAGTFAGIWKVVRARIAPVVAQLESPLWGAEINTAVAEAVTIAPVGRI
jgi:hypothetical protein